jgi:hypothetical protein
MKLVITIDTADAAECPDTPYTASVTLDGEEFRSDAILGESLGKILEKSAAVINYSPPSEAVIRDAYKSNSTFRHIVDAAVESWAGADTAVFHIDNDYLRGQVELIRDLVTWKNDVDQDQVRDQLIDFIAELHNPDRN